MTANKNGGHKNRSLLILNFVLHFALTFLCVYRFSLLAPLALVETFDLGWLIQTGVYISKSGIPHHDVFSWTFPERAFTAYQWLAELFLGTLYQWGGFYSIGLLASIAAGLLYFFILPSIWLSMGVRVPLILGAMSFILTPHFFNARPQLFSYLALLGTVLLMEKVSGLKKYLLFLPLLAIWVNVHSFWLFGLGIVIIYLLQEKNLKILPVIACIVALLAVTLLNPYGAGLHAYLKTFLDGSQFMQMREVEPSWTDPAVKTWLIYMIFAWLTILRAGKKLSPAGIFACLITTIFSILVRRYQSLAVIVTWFYFGQAISFIPQARAVDLIQPARMRLLLAAIAITTPLIVWTLICPSEKAARVLFYEGNEDVLDYYRELKNDYQGFCDPTSGSWLIAKGCLPVFIDTRYDMYPKDFCQTVLTILRSDPNWSQSLSKWPVKMLLLRDDFPLHQTLLADKNWYPAVDNGRLSIWLPGAVSQNKAELTRLTLGDEQLIALAKEHPQNPLFARTLQARHIWYLNIRKTVGDQQGHGGEGGLRQLKIKLLLVNTKL